jgi:uncharacterized protein
MPDDSPSRVNLLKTRLPPRNQARKGGFRPTPAPSSLSRTEFEELTVCLFEAVPGPRALARQEVESLQDAHLKFLAGLHENAVLQVAGPFENAAPSTTRGMSIHRLSPGAVRDVLAEDPWVVAGYLSVRAFTWRVPRGAMSFGRTTFPRSRAET